MASPNYEHQRQWSDRYIPAIKQIVGPLLLDISTFEQDTKEATDLVILQTKGSRIACRIRRAKYQANYSHEFTLRNSSKYGPSELEKVINGLGDYMFYGFAADDGRPMIDKWYFLSLDSFRKQYKTNRNIRTGKKGNYDGTSFVYFDIRTFSNEPRVVLVQGQMYKKKLDSDLPF